MAEGMNYIAGECLADRKRRVTSAPKHGRYCRPLLARKRRSKGCLPNLVAQSPQVRHDIFNQNVPMINSQQQERAYA